LLCISDIFERKLLTLNKVSRDNGTFVFSDKHGPAPNESIRGPSKHRPHSGR